MEKIAIRFYGEEGWSLVDIIRHMYIDEAELIGKVIEDTSINKDRVNLTLKEPKG